jgi:hypothetical protein
MTGSNLDRIVKDIQLVARAIDVRWHANRATSATKADADRIRRVVDMDALRRCLRFLLDDDAPAGIARGYAAAQRLETVLRTIELHQAEIASRLRAA